MPTAALAESRLQVSLQDLLSIFVARKPMVGCVLLPEGYVRDREGDSCDCAELSE